MVGAALTADRTRIVLTTDGQEAKRYTLQVTNVRANGNGALVDPFLSTAEFLGVAANDIDVPTVVRAVAIDPTTVQVTFSEPVWETAADATRYGITTAGGSVLPVLDVEVNDFATQATLTTVAQDDVTYGLTITGLRDLAGNETSTPRVEFAGLLATGGDVLPPRVAGALSTGPTSLIVAFSEPVGVSAEVAAHYAIAGLTTGPIAPQAVLSVTSATLSEDARSVTLITGAQSEIEYSLKVVNVRDLAGNAVAPPDRENPYQTTFLGTGTSGSPTDSDGDGLSDAAEQRGWTVTVRFTDGTRNSYEVTSDPGDPALPVDHPTNVAARDTDGDGVGDLDERAFRTDPRNVDTDGDDTGASPGDLTDYRELTDLYSDPTDQDSDGDGLDDGLEFSFFRTSPTLEDSDGDQIPDADEIDLANRNARLADLPLLGIEIDTIDLQLDVRFEATSSQGTRQLESETVETTLETSESQTYANTDTNTDEFYANVGTEQGVNQDGTLGYSGSWSAEAGYSGAWQSEFTDESAFATQEAFNESLTTESETTAEESVTRTVEDAVMNVAVYLRNLGNVAFTLENVELTALRYDLRTRSYVPVASLVPAGGSGTFTLGLEVRERGPIVFTSDQVFPSVVEELMKNPTSLRFKVANYDLTDEDGRNFEFTSQEINDRTASLVIDFGSYDTDGDGVGDTAERYRVATSAGRPVDDTNGNGSLDGEDRRIVYDARGDQLGITLREALEEILGLTHYDEDATPWTSLDAFELGASYSTVVVNDVETLYRVRGATNDLARNQRWDILTPTGIDRTIDFADRVLRTEDGLALALSRDVDGDLLTGRQEFGLGASDDSLDSDGDGLDDRFEVATRWTVDYGRGSIEAYPSPGRADTDRDGLSDWEEFNACVAERDADGVPLLNDTAMVDVGVNLGVVLAVPTCDLLFDDGFGTPTGLATAPDDADTDDDGVSDADEALGYTIALRVGGSITVRTDPTNPDTDGDGTVDGRERDLGGNPTDPTDGNTFLDDDDDGLTNAEEAAGWTVTTYALSTAANAQGAATTRTVTSLANVADVDGDGLDDSDERDLGTDPNLADTDGDGVDDGAEVVAVLDGVTVRYDLVLDPTDADLDDDLRLDGDELTVACSVGPVDGITTTVFSDPLVADVDGDGLVDGEECALYATDPTEGDTDGDGVADGNEVAIGTDPLEDDKLVRLTITTIDVIFDCDSGDNGGNFEGFIRSQGPDGAVFDLVNLDLIDGVDHDTNEGIEEGDTATIDASVDYTLTSGQSFRFYQQDVVETTGDDAEFDDNAITLDQTVNFSFVDEGADSITLDDGNDCSIRINWTLNQITAP